MVDDEESFRSITSKMLTRRGFHTTMAASGEEAIALLKTSEQNVVVLDMKMPGMDGHATLVEIKKIKPTIPVIMLTGYAVVESARYSFREGAFDYLSKPCDIDLLAAKINEAASADIHDRANAEKTAGELMIPLEDYTTIDPDVTVREGIACLKESFESAIATGKVMETGHRSIVVLDKSGRVQGILSIFDLIRALQPEYLSYPKPSTADSLHYSPIFWRGMFTSQAMALGEKRVGDIMSEAVREVDAHTNLMELTHLMFTKQIRRLVVTEGGKPVGIVREQEIFFELARILAAN